MCEKSLAYLALPLQPPSAHHRIHELSLTYGLRPPEVLDKEG
jgi:hypothetical protein